MRIINRATMPVCGIFRSPEYDKIMKEIASMPVGGKLAAPLELPHWDTLELSDLYKRGQVISGADLKVGSSSSQVVEETDLPDHLIIRSMDMYKFTPSSCKVNEQKGYIDSYFFHADTDFLVEAGEQINSEGKYDRYSVNANTLTYYAQGLVDFFGDQGDPWNTRDQLVQSLRDAAFEMADRLKNGESSDVRSLTTTLSINGEDVTIGELMDMRNMANKIIDSFGSDFYGSAAGTRQYYDYVQKGMIQAVATQYGQSLSSKLGDAFSARFTDMVQNNISCGMDSFNELILNDNPEWKNWIREMSENAFEMFSKLDLSSRTVADAEFHQKLDRFLETVANGKYGGSTQTINFYRGYLTDAYNRTSQVIFS